MMLPHAVHVRFLFEVEFCANYSPASWRGMPWAASSHIAPGMSNEWTLYPIRFRDLPTAWVTQKLLPRAASLRVLDAIVKSSGHQRTKLKE